MAKVTLTENVGIRLTCRCVSSPYLQRGDLSDFYLTKIVSLPNLQIIDFSYGYTGSTHDATAWEQTRLAQEHETLLQEGEWVWADSAYPVSETQSGPYNAYLSTIFLSDTDMGCSAIQGTRTNAQA